MLKNYNTFSTKILKLMSFDIISDKNVYKNYAKERDNLFYRVLNQSRAIFYTIVKARNCCLRRLNIDDVVQTWLTTTEIIDETECCSFTFILLMIMTFRKQMSRFILIDNYKQLSSYSISQETFIHWSEFFLKFVVDNKKWSVIQLNVQFRMHHWLYVLVNDIIYEKKVKSFKRTKRPSLYLNKLMSNMSLNFNVESYRNEFTLYFNFINVAHEITQIVSKDSNSNETKVEVISVLIKKFLKINKDAQIIAVITSYLRQLKLLKSKIKTNKWDHIKRIMFIDTFQDDQYEIVIISLVRTEMLRVCRDWVEFSSQ